MDSVGQSEITGVILVGGKSRRMGQDKAFLQVQGIALFDRVLSVFRECFPQILLVGDRPERFAAYDLPMVADIYPGSALGGLYTGLQSSLTEHIFVASCDMPYLSGRVIEHLCLLRHGYDAVVPLLSHGFEPLCALYAKSCLPVMQQQLEQGNFCVYDIYDRLRIQTVPEASLAKLDPSGRCLASANTPEEFALLTGRCP